MAVRPWVECAFRICKGKPHPWWGCDLPLHPAPNSRRFTDMPQLSSRQAKCLLSQHLPVIHLILTVGMSKII